MSGTLFTDLITSEHINKPKFVATVGGLTQGFLDTLSQFNYYPTLFSVDEAIGVQLDVIGVWVGATRNVALLIDAYFSWDTAGVGWDQGIWWVVGDSLTTVARLSDSDFRNLIKAKIICNTWTGDLPTACLILQQFLQDSSITVSAIESDQKVTFTITGNISTIAKAVITGGYLPLKPTGVVIDYTFAT